jgi:SAM-dependent methyltransferase
MVATNWVTLLTRTRDSNYFEVLPSVAHHITTPWIQFDKVRPAHALEYYIEKDPYPLPTTEDREGYYGNRHYDYWLSGLKDYLIIKDVLQRHRAPLHVGDHIMELGCASGRVLRHFASQEAGLNIWGVDIDKRHIDWILHYLPPTIKAVHTTALPHLPIEDNVMAVVLAFSVFTHIDEMEVAWLAEVRRILKPGGIAYLTIATEHSWSLLQPGMVVYESLMSLKDHIIGYQVSPEFFAQPMPEERIVFKWPTIAQVYNCCVYHATSYVHRTWGRFLDILDIIEEGSEHQAVVILRKNYS